MSRPVPGADDGPAARPSGPGSGSDHPAPPPSSAAPARPRPGVAAAAAYGLCVLALFAGAAALRGQWPREPFADDDVWGYLWGPLRKLTGGHFEHVLGREYAYPTLVEWTVFFLGGFRAITTAQHAWGLAGGAGLLACCHLLAAIGRPGTAAATPRSGAATAPAAPCWVGLALTATYLLNTRNVLYEHSLRPESVLPGFALASVGLNLFVVYRRLVRGERRGVLTAAGVNLVVTAGLLLLRPSFRLSALLANVPFLLLLFDRGSATPWPRRLFVLGWSLAGAVCLWLPEHEYARADRARVFYLPERLFTVHADLIARQVGADLAAGRADPAAAGWLRALDDHLGAVLAASRRPENHPWPGLGFNADYLVLQEHALRPFFSDDPAGDRALAGFCYRYYARAWRGQPGAMARKVLLQVGSFYLPGPPDSRLVGAAAEAGAAAGRRPVWRVPVAPLYADTLRCLRAGPKYEALLGASEDARAYLRWCGQRAGEAGTTAVSLAAVDWLDEGLTKVYPLGLLLGGAALGLLPWRQRRCRRAPPHLAALGAAQALLFAYPFGACLVTAVVFYVESRYVTSLDSLRLVSLYASGLFAWRCVQAARAG